MRLTPLFLAALAASSPANAATRDTPWIWGVTIAAPADMAATKASLEQLPQRAMARLVFDPELPIAHYRETVRQLGSVSDLMGQVLDSIDIEETPLDTYRKRARDLLAEYGAAIPLWEIGNEVNGDWAGDPKAVAEKIGAAYDEVTAAKRGTALTLYYNAECAEKPGNEMFAWIDRYLPARVRSVDYVFVSYYQDDCPGPAPDWRIVFQELADLFPGTHLGFGETGTADPAHKERYLRQYYGLKIPVAGFVGGYFWWQGVDDFVPLTKPLWKILSELIGPANRH